jgi:phosphoesterase family protein
MYRDVLLSPQEPRQVLRVTNILGRQQGVTQPLLKTILKGSGRSAKANIMRRTPQKNSALPGGYWELNNSSPLTPVFNRTVVDFLTEHQVAWRYYEHGYCFLRFFEKYTFDHTNIVDADDPLKGFYVNTSQGTLPSVSFIDPHFIEMPPGANCDRPPADIKDGQALAQKIVEAVVAGRKWNKTVLVIIYDEHGGFYDHVAPPNAERFGNEPVMTYGVRVPAFVISPLIKSVQVFGHDAGCYAAGPVSEVDACEKRRLPF